MSKFNDKETEIKRYLKELADIFPETFEEYRSSLEKKAACERYFEKIIVALTDLAYLVITQKKLQVPEDEANAFSILENNNIITKSTSEKIKDARKMRNVIAHQYAVVDDNIIFESIKNELEKDVNNFIKEVKKCL